MTELILGLAWPVAVVVVAVLALLAWSAAGTSSAEKSTDAAIDRLGREAEALRELVNAATKRLKQVEEGQERHATLLGKREKGGQL